MKLTKDILDAMAKSIDETGSQRLFSQKTGIATQNISKYMNGKVKSIRPELWKKLYPHIVRWLPSWPGGFPEDGAKSEEDRCSKQSVSIYRDREKIDFLITDSEGLTLNLRLEKVLMKQYYYMDSVMRQMFPTQIAAEVKKRLQEVSIDKNMPSRDTSAELNPINDEVNKEDAEKGK